MPRFIIIDNTPQDDTRDIYQTQLLFNFVRNNQYQSYEGIIHSIQMYVQNRADIHATDSQGKGIQDILEERLQDSNLIIWSNEVQEQVKQYITALLDSAPIFPKKIDHDVIY